MISNQYINQYNVNIFIQKAKKIHDDKYDYSLVNYKNNKTTIQIICPKHGIFQKRPDVHISQKQGCPLCKKITTEIFIQRSNKIHNNKYNYSKTIYYNMYKKVLIICPQHNEFYQRPHDHIHNKQGCPKCNSSKGELEIEQFLKEHNIKYETQKRFKDCRDKRPLPFDFYLPDHNTCIEFDGEHHYINIRYNNKNINSLKNTQQRDTIKNNYCKQKNIRLIRISYKEIISITSEQIMNLITK
jgi:very-short-patch-repair endonuclease